MRQERSATSAPKIITTRRHSPDQQEKKKPHHQHGSVCLTNKALFDHFRVIRLTKRTLLSNPQHGPYFVVEEIKRHRASLLTVIAENRSLPLIVGCRHRIFFYPLINARKYVFGVDDRFLTQWTNVIRLRSITAPSPTLKYSFKQLSCIPCPQTRKMDIFREVWSHSPQMGQLQKSLFSLHTCWFFPSIPRQMLHVGQWYESMLRPRPCLHSLQ